MDPLPLGSPVADYQRQANAFSDQADPRRALAYWYGFRDWSVFVDWLDAISEPDSEVGRFERAVEAIVSGDRATLERLLTAYPDLVQARSTIVTPNDQAQHHATLLHYVAANGVEGWRQRTPPNAVEIATLLLEGGAEPDARADMYGDQHTTMTMLVSSAHPARAGLQIALAETLLDYGAALDGSGPGTPTSPLLTALAFGYSETAQALVRRGAGTEDVAVAAGLGRVDDARRLLATADAETRHRATALAAQHGQTEVLRLLLEAGQDPNRYNPRGFHGHSTPLHQAVWSDHLDTVQLLVERGARLDVRDTVFQGTPLGWAEYGKREAIAAYLRSRSAS